MESKEIFQANAAEDYTSSLIFMKQLTVVSISIIMYLKDALPEDSYTVLSFEGIKLHIIKKICNNDLAQFISTSLVDAFDAIDKKYLHQLMLCFYEGERKFENLVESHVFEYIYKDDGVYMTFSAENKDKNTIEKHTFENIRGQARSLVRTLIVLMDASRRELNPTFGLSLRLYYREDVPADYHAPGFSPSENQDHLNDGSLEVLKVRSVETPFHKLRLQSSFKMETTQASDEAIPTQNTPNLSNEDDLGGEEGLAYGRPRLLCPCYQYDDNEYSNAGDLLTCSYCATQQHPACFGILREDVDSVTKHCCALCHDADPTRPPTDYEMVPLAPIKRACICIFRRALEYLLQLEYLDAATLAKRFRMSSQKAYKLMKILHQSGIIPQDPSNDLNERQRISQIHLKYALNKYFNTKESVIDQIEMLACQESLQSDPIADALNPLKQLDIQNTSSFGRVIDTPSKPIVEDSTLKDYREAFISEDIDEPRLLTRPSSKRKIANASRGKSNKKKPPRKSK